MMKTERSRWDPPVFLLAGILMTVTGATGPLCSVGADLLPEAMPHYLNGSTRRLAQLTGDYDPEGLPHINFTEPWGVEGVDLGANTEHDGRLFIFFGDVPQRPTGRKWPPHDADPIAYIEDGRVRPASRTAEERKAETGEIRLTPVLQDGLFHPFTEREGILGTNETPTGAFSHGGRAYVFIVKGGSSPYSVLTSSRDPASPMPFKRHFVLSDAAAGSGRFWQVAPWVVRNAEVSGLPSNDGDGVILLGHGRARSGFGVHLAWMPLRPDREPGRSELRYCTGDSVNSWSIHEADATTLFATKFAWTSLSLGRIPTIGRWMLLYQRTGANEAPDEHIVARIAATPWGLAQAAEVSIFDPVRDGALGKYMYRPGWPDPYRLQDRAPRIGHPSFAYGAFLLNRYSLWNSAEETVTIHYLMSTGCPYQVQLMRSSISFKDRVRRRP